MSDFSVAARVTKGEPAERKILSRWFENSVPAEMNNLVQHIFALTNGDPADLKQLHTLLNKHADDVLGKAGAAELDEALVQLDPSLHTLGWVYLLYVLK